MEHNNGRLEYEFKVKFVYDKYGVKEEVDQYVNAPYEVFMETLIKWANDSYMVNLDGTDNHIWNMLNALKVDFEELMNDKLFVEELTNSYMKSSYYDDDYDDFVDDYEFEHELGSYKGEND